MVICLSSYWNDTCRGYCILIFREEIIKLHAWKIKKKKWGQLSWIAFRKTNEFARSLKKVKRK
jgi:hypothetical protein